MSFVPDYQEQLQQHQNQQQQVCRLYTPIEWIEKLNLPGADVWVAHHVFSSKQASELFTKLKALPFWSYRSLSLFGKVCSENRSTASFALSPSFQGTECSGPDSINYRYSGRNHIGEPAPSVVLTIYRHIESWISRTQDIKALYSNETPLYNFVLGNMYADGSESIGLHSDDEKCLSLPIIAVSLGASRKFDFHGRHQYTSIKKRIVLEAGSVLVMAGSTQKNYKHRIPVEKRVTATRISLTFRKIEPSIKHL